ncbi:hypothetical protein [Legionella sp.]|uniref:hypothetical protein n=1 Tax=Legionella sp. TaxID=459 RepID=UPI000CC7BC65|nr:hypothetical protein [Legionella sp.]PJE13589.1 MAG: hypothetical protein CK430_06200 [Legionella sp.]
MKRDSFYYCLLIGILCFPFTVIAEPAKQKTSQVQTQPPEPKRRAKPAPFDSIFPSTEYLGPTIGVPNSDPVYPINKFIWKAIPALERKNIRIYGWINPSYNASSSKNSNYPLTYSIVPNRIELEQSVLRIERLPDTVQVENIDWGFRLSNIYGMDYRFTTSQGYFSSQLLKRNKLYGYDLVEASGQLYFPLVAEGMVITLGVIFPLQILKPNLHRKII